MCRQHAGGVVSDCMSLTSAVSNTSSPLPIPANIIVIESFIVLSQGSPIIPNISNILFPLEGNIHALDLQEWKVIEMARVRIFKILIEFLKRIILSCCLRLEIE